MLHCFTLLYIDLHCFILLYIALHWCTLLYIALHCFKLLYTVSQFSSLLFIALHCFWRICTALYWFILVYTALHYFTLLYTGLTGLHCNAIKCILVKCPKTKMHLCRADLIDQGWHQRAALICWGCHHVYISLVCCAGRHNLHKLTWSWILSSKCLCWDFRDIRD